MAFQCHVNQSTHGTWTFELKIKSYLEVLEIEFP